MRPQRSAAEPIFSARWRTASSWAKKLRAETYDLVLSDLKMPELDGPGLYETLARDHPHMLRRVVFLTGDALSSEITAFLERAGAPYLYKSFTLEELRRVIQRTLPMR